MSLEKSGKERFKVFIFAPNTFCGHSAGELPMVDLLVELLWLGF